MDGLFMLLSACIDASREPYRQALCRDTQLMGQLAKLTAACHAALPTWCHWAREGLLTCRLLVTRAGSWAALPWELPAAGGELALLPLLVAAGSMLQREAADVRRLRLPGHDQHGELQGLSIRVSDSPLAERWSIAIAALSSLSSLLFAPPAGAAPAAGSRALHVFLSFAEAGPAAARFFAATDITPAGRKKPAAAAVAPPHAQDLALLWSDWVDACSRAFRALGACAAGLTAEQQRKAAAAAIGLAHALVWLLPQLPPLAHALNAGRASAAGPAEGCSCPACRGAAGHIQLDGSKLICAVQEAVSA
jgi:hypothetical protein